MEEGAWGHDAEFMWGPEMNVIEDDPEEIPVGDDEWDAFSDVTADDGE